MEYVFWKTLGYFFISIVYNKVFFVGGEVKTSVQRFWAVQQKNYHKQNTLHEANKISCKEQREVRKTRELARTDICRAWLTAD
jgi:hypothetical protein